MHERLGIRHLQIFTDGLEALSAIRQTEDSELLPSLVLSDLQMPIMDGFEFVGQLKELACYHRRQPTVVACSGKHVLVFDVVMQLCSNRDLIKAWFLLFIA